MSKTIVLDGEFSLEVPIDGETGNLLRVGGGYDPDEIIPIIDREVEAALTRAKESGLFDGADGQDGQDGYTPIKGIDYFDGQDGQDGKDGKDGVDGYTPVKGVDYFDGADGKDGQDGYTPVKGVDYFDGQDGYTPIKGVDYFDGATGATGEQGPPGNDYILTSADKAEIAGLVAAGLPTETWTFTLDDDSTVTKEVVVMEQ